MLRLHVISDDDQSCCEVARTTGLGNWAGQGGVGADGKLGGCGRRNWGGDDGTQGAGR